MDGGKLHGTEDLAGERWSVVFDTGQNMAHTDLETRRQLEEWGAT